MPYQATYSSGYHGRAAGYSPEETCQAIVALFPKPLMMNGGSARSTVTYVGVQQVNAAGWHCKLHYDTVRVSDGAPMPNESGLRLFDGVGGPVCIPANYEVAIAGPMVTKAMPAGPALAQVASVRQGGNAVAGRSVTIRADGAFYTSGVTNAAGEYRFIYAPPRVGGITVHLEATCDNCTNTAAHDIAIEPCDVCAGQGEVGNPIQPASGEKIQRESDWTDAAAHPLNLTRTYRSQGRFTASLGDAWTHNWSAFLNVASGPVLYLPDGSSVLFQATAQTASWVAANRDTLLRGGDAYLFTRASDDSQWSFNAAGRPTRITQRNGWSYTLHYAGANLTQVTNAFGRRLSFIHDGLGRLSAVITPDAARVVYGHDGANRLASVTYGDGGTRHYFYEDSRWPRALTSIFDEAGNRYAGFAYDAKGRAILTEHVGGSQRYTVSYTDSSGGTTDDPRGGGAIVRGITRGDEGASGSPLAASATITDPSGAQRSYTWSGGDGSAQLVASNGSYDGMRTASRSLNSAGLAQTETDFNGVQTAHAWDSSRRLKVATTVAVGRPETRITYTQWHPQLRLPVRIEERGRTTEFGYDAQGNLISQRISDSASGEVRSSSWTYARGLMESYTDAAQRTWRYGYGAEGQLVALIDPQERTTGFTHDAAGRVLTQTSPGRALVRLSYDARGRLLTRTEGELTTRYTYTPIGQIASVTSPDGYQVAYAYDRAHRMVSAADNRGATIAYTLDAAGKRIHEEVKDASGALALAVARSFDRMGRLMSVDSATGQRTLVRHDGNGDLVNITSPLAQETGVTLDGLGRPVTALLTDGETIQHGWGPLDQLQSVTDPKGVRTGYERNAFGDTTSETSPDIGTMKYTRNAAGEATQVEDAKGQLTRIERDAMGRVRTLTHADGKVTRYEYNAAGDVTQMTDGSGWTQYARDETGRVTRKTQAVADVPDSPSTYAVGYGYANGRLADVTYPSGMKVSYTRVAGRITGINVRDPSQTRKTVVIPFVANLTHTALGQPRSWNWVSGDSASRSFDADGRPTASEFASLGYDAAGRITGVTQKLWITASTSGTPVLAQEPVTWNAGYDLRDRLVRFARTGASSTYSYDANSNRLTAVEVQGSDADLQGAFDQPAIVQTRTQTLNVEPASNRMLGFSQVLTGTQAGQPTASSRLTVNYEVDANGSMTRDGLRDFDYDASGRLAKVRITRDGDAAAVTYLHNGIGQRVFKSDAKLGGEVSTEKVVGADFISWLRQSFGWLFNRRATVVLGDAFVYGDGEIPPWALLAEKSNGASDGASAEYIWLPTEGGNAIPIGMYKSGRLYAIHADHIGTPRLITDSANRPVWQWPYSAFGNNEPAGVLQKTTGGSGEVTIKATTPGVVVNLRYPGQYADQESGLVYNMFRSYDARRGGYVQADPIGLGGGMARFGYADHAPIGKIDPLGLWSTPVHDQIIRDRFGPTLSSESQALIEKGSAAVDAWHNQLPFFGNDYEHAMRAAGQSADEAKRRTCLFIQRHMDDYRRNRNGPNWREAYKSLGMALHPIMDSTSPAHQGWQEWDLRRDWRHHGSFSKSRENWIHPHDLARTIDLINKALSGDECACIR